MGRFQVRLIAAKNLALISQWGYTEPFCTFIVGTTKSTVASNRYTTKRMKSASPLFNQVLTFDVKDPNQDKLYVQFFDYDDNSVQHAIGEAAISLNNLRRGVEQNNWYRLINCLSGDVNLAITALDFDTSSGSAPALQMPAVGQQAPSNSSLSQAAALLAPLPAQSPSPSQPSLLGLSGSSGSVGANGLINFGAAPLPVQPPPLQQQQQQQPPGGSGLLPPPPVAAAGPSVGATPLTPLDPKAIQRDFPHFAKGSFGVIFTGTVKGIAQKVVIKDMEVHNQRNVEDWKKEIAMMSRMRSPYVVEVLGYCSSGHILTIVMEYMVKGSLYDVLHVRKEPLSLIQRMRMARQCALGVAHLHAAGVIHRDIKSMNILCASDYSCKLTDFGCAKLINDRTVFNTANSGTPLWMAPEVKAGQYDFSADVYSLGLVLYELFENKLPYYDTMRQTVVLPKAFQSASVVLPCVSARAASRPTAQQVVKVLDMMIRNVVHKVRRALPPAEEALLFGSGGSSVVVGPTASGLPDDLDVELQRLYTHLLTKDATYVDNLISRAFSMSDSTPSSLSMPPSSSTSVSLPASPAAPPSLLHPVQPSHPPMHQSHSAPVSPLVHPSHHMHAPQMVPPSPAYHGSSGFVGSSQGFGAPPLHASGGAAPGSSGYSMPVASHPMPPNMAMGGMTGMGSMGGMGPAGAAGGISLMPSMAPVPQQPPRQTVDDLFEMDLSMNQKPAPSTSSAAAASSSAHSSKPPSNSTSSSAAVGQLIPGLFDLPGSAKPTTPVDSNGSSGSGGGSAGLYPKLDDASSRARASGGASTLSARDIERLTNHLESLSMYELRDLLYQYQVDDSQCFDKNDLVRLTRNTLGPQVLQQIGGSSSNTNSSSASKSAYPKSTSSSSAGPSDGEIARARDMFKVYADDDAAVTKEMTILILSELLRGRMTEKDIRSKTSAEFDALATRDAKKGSSEPLLELDSFLTLYHLLWQQCQIVI